MLTTTKTLVTASLIALTAAPVLADSPRVGISPAEAYARSNNFEVQGKTEIDGPRFDRIGDRTVDIKSTNRDMGILDVSRIDTYLRPDLKLTNSPLLGTAVIASDDTRVGFVREVYQTPEGEHVAVADIEDSIGAVADRFAVRVDGNAGAVKLPIDRIDFTNAAQMIRGGEGPSY